MRSSVIIFLLLVSTLSVTAQTSSAKWKLMEAKGDTLLNAQDFQGALKIYNNVIELSKLKDTESKGVLYKRAICFYSVGEFQKALDDLKIFIPEYPGFPRAKLLRAFINRELGDTQAQLDDINELLSINPTNPDLLKFKASIFLETEKYNEAKTALLDLQKVVNDEEIETQLGFIYSSLNEPDSAFDHFDAALSINGGYSPAYLYISSLCLEQGANELALTYIDLGLRLEPENTTLQFYKGVALAETENLTEGCRMLAKAFYGGLDQAGDYLKQYCYSEEN
jgi:tetratricopeptide (TPR) repeat protein